MSKYSIKNLQSVPWFIFSWATKDLITSKTVPETVSDTKSISRPGTQIPGGGSEVSKFGSISSRKISFSIKMANFNNNLGISPKVKALENLRNPAPPFLGFGAPKPFSPNPSVLYYHGTGSSVLWYFVTKCDFTLSHQNRIGMPQVVTASISLTLDEEGTLYTIERIYRQVTAKLGLAQSLKEQVSSTHPYRTGSSIL